MAFHVGQLVAGTGNKAPVAKGRIYTISGHCQHPGCNGVFVCEIEPPGEYSCFHPECFRPITEDRLAIFRQHLVPKRDEVSA